MQGIGDIIKLIVMVRDVINSPKKEMQKQSITTIQFVVLLFLLSVCTTFSKGHRALHFQKSFKCDHFLFIFGLVYHTA